MKCEEFEAVGLGLDRESAAHGLDPMEFAAAMEHADTCARCAALQESWQDARAELQALREVTQGAGAPLRVEMRLRQAFWAKRRAMKIRSFALTGTWVLASATLLIVGMSWWNWRIAQENISLQSASTPLNAAEKKEAPTNTNSALVTVSEVAENIQHDTASDTTLVAANDAEDFTLLPGSLPQETGDAAVVRVRLQRGALGELGLPVNEERAGEWIQVDLFVGQDGQPQAVRLPR